MKWTASRLDSLLTSGENEHLEFKEARRSYSFDNLVKYCVALANEGGGLFILGVSNKRPRRVGGTNAFSDLSKTKLSVMREIGLRVNACSVAHPGGRVLVFDVPGRPVGTPIHRKGTYWMRSGESLVPMTPDVLRRIMGEAESDFSAQVCENANLNDLAPAAIDRFRAMWSAKADSVRIAQLDTEQLLTDAGLVTECGITYAALILLGKDTSLDRLLACTEVVFEYRSSNASGPAQQRMEFRKGFLLFAEELWNTINLRNEIQHFRDGLFVYDIPTFGESSIREAILNAVSHRDYRLGDSVFIRQYPKRLEIVSPGGFPAGITRENVLWKQSPRNRKIAEVLARCGLVERAGQGTRLIFEESIRQGKPLPDFGGTDDYQVCLTICGNVQDEGFLKFIERIGQERLRTFSTKDFLVLDSVRREASVPEQFKGQLTALVEEGIIERVGRGRGVRHLLSKRYYSITGKKGVYTRKRGLDRGTNKALLLKHIEDNRAQGSGFSELWQVLPSLSRETVRSLLNDLRDSGRIECRGRTKGARWYPNKNQ